MVISHLEKRLEKKDKQVNMFLSATEFRDVRARAIIHRVGGGYSEQGLFGTHRYIFDILSNLTSPTF